MSMKSLLAAAVLLSALPAPVAAKAVPAPRMTIQNLGEIATPLPYPYDETADADHMVALAKAKARSSGRKLLVDMGGNWCGDCRVLAALMARPELKTFLDAHYVIVTVDVGRMDKNLQIPRHYGIAKLSGGVPALMVIDPHHDRLINRAQLFALEDARHMTPQALADWLAQWA